MHSQVGAYVFRRWTKPWCESKVTTWLGVNPRIGLFVKYQFTSRTLFMLTASVVFAILDIQVWSRYIHLLYDNTSGIEAQEKSRLQDKLGYLSVRETRASFYIAIPSFEPMTFVTRIFIAKDHRAKSLVISTTPNGASSLQWSHWEKSVVFPIDWTGDHTVTVRVNKQKSGNWSTTIQEGDSNWEIPLDPKDTNFLEPGADWSRTFWKQDFLGVNPRLSPDAIKLLAIDAVLVRDLQKSFKPTNGLHIWVE